MWCFLLRPQSSGGKVGIYSHSRYNSFCRNSSFKTTSWQGCNIYYTHAHAHILCKERVVNKIRQFIYICEYFFWEFFLLSYLVLMFVLSCNHTFTIVTQKNLIQLTEPMIFSYTSIYLYLSVCVCDKHKDSPIKLIAELLKISCYRPLNLPAWMNPAKPRLT